MYLVVHLYFGTYHLVHVQGSSQKKVREGGGGDQSMFVVLTHSLDQYQRGFAKSISLLML